MNKTKGFSLVEMLTCCALLVIAVCIALPGFDSLLQANRRTQDTNLMLVALHYARSTAVFERQIVAICAGGAHCDQSQSWRGQLLVFADRNRNGALEDGERLLQALPLEEGVSWYWGRQVAYLQFEPDGTTRALNGTLTLCEGNRPQKQIVIGLAGRTRTQSPAATAHCS